jgi:hypothetical protein
MEIFIILTTLLLLPLIPAFILYKFLPSKTAVKGPFKGLNINLTGAFGGYFLLVLISLGLIYTLRNDKLSAELKQAKQDLVTERSKYQQWTMSGRIISNAPELTKIFVDGQFPSPSSNGQFEASLFMRQEGARKLRLPSAVCFYNKNEGYKIIDLTRKNYTVIDTMLMQIQITDTIRLNRNDYGIY